jgi:ABC-2 type transport system permease protein
VGLSTDLSTGLIDRLRALPMWHSSILAARAISDLMTAAVCAAAVALTGLAVGWRPDAALISVAAGFGIALLFSFAISWGLGCAGLVARSAESAASLGFILLFPLAFVSNAMVPTQGMPGWLRVIADWNPVSAVTAAVRQLFGNPNPSAAITAWPMQHPVAAALVWSVAILAASLPLSVFLYRRRTAD